MNLKPCPKFYSNSPFKQLCQIASELCEVAWALLLGRTEEAAMEIVDVQVSCETMLVCMGYNDRKRAEVRRNVLIKNINRGYLRGDENHGS